MTVCGTPFGVKMFSEGALIVGFSEIGQAGGGTSNPAKEAGLRLGDRVICIGQTRTESNEAVKEALDAAEGQSVEVVYIRSGEQKLTTLTPVWDFYGWEEYLHDDRKEPGTPNRQYSYLTINAIDGSMVDRALGY